MNESLANQIKHLMDADADEDELQNAMDQHKSKLEELFAAGLLKRAVSSGLFLYPYTCQADTNSPLAQGKTQTQTHKLGF